MTTSSSFEEIDNDPIIKESMADVGALMVGTFGRYLAPLLIAAHTANHAEGFVTEKIMQVGVEFDGGDE